MCVEKYTDARIKFRHERAAFLAGEISQDGVNYTGYIFRGIPE